MSEARNLRNMSMAQTPLLGEENTPIHTDASGGTGFESATPRHQVAFTPNPLATPLREDGIPATPRNGASSTPLRTPIRDNLSLNANGQFTGVDETPRDVRLRRKSGNSALQAGFSSLPKPENNFELLVPDEDEDDTQDPAGLSEEDAAERDARIRKAKEEQERKALARRSHAVRQGLPRPPNVDVARLHSNFSRHEAEGDLLGAQNLIDAELASLLLHDSIAHPVPGTTNPGSTLSSYDHPAYEDLEAAREQVHIELASLVGFPNATPAQLREGLLQVSKTEVLDESASWSQSRQHLILDASSQLWVDMDSLSLEARVPGYDTVLQQNKELMSREASKASKAEKKLNVTLGGYMARSKALTERIDVAFHELQKTRIDLESFSRLQVGETAVGPRRVAALKEEVEALERRERTLQGRYAELEGEKRDAEHRVAAAEERVMAEAEALNEAHLAEMEGVQN